MEKARICKNCKHFDRKSMKKYCKYWISEIGAIITTYGCEKFEAKEE